MPESEDGLEDFIEKLHGSDDEDPDLLRAKIIAVGALPKSNRSKNPVTVNGRNGTLLITHGKTEAARRVLPMTPRVRRTLEMRWEACGRPLEGYVWPAPRAGTLNHPA
jgi:hypothetical protein